MSAYASTSELSLGYASKQAEGLFTVAFGGTRLHHLLLSVVERKVDI
jgi:hypothetical protein